MMFQAETAGLALKLESVLTAVALWFFNLNSDWDTV